MSIHDIPDDLLRQILFLLDYPLWLLRPACASHQFDRAVAGGGRAFLRLAGSLHPPVVVGHYHDRSALPITFVPASPPPPPIDGRRFSLAFLPRRVATTTDWEVADCHGGLVLLCETANSLPDLIVCDPLTRRYQGIPHPEKRAGSAFALLDGDGDGDGSISISNFRALYRFHQFLGDGGAPHQAGVFSAADGGGGGGWRFLRRRPGAGSNDYKGHVAGRVDGSIYLDSEAGTVRVLDNASLELSEVHLPIGIDTSNNRSRFTVVRGAGPSPTSPPSTWIIHVHGEELEFFRRVRATGGGSGEWVLEHSTPKLSEAARGLLGGCPEKRLEWNVVDVIAVLSATADQGKRRWFFTVNMDTKELQVAPKESYRRTRGAFTYTLPWPQLLRACPS